MTRSSAAARPEDLDPVSALVLDEAGVPDGGWAGAGVLVVDDEHGVLTRVLVGRGAVVLALCDDLRDAEAAVAAGAELAEPWGQTTWPGLVLGRLPTSLAALDDLAERIAHRCPADVAAVLGGRVKHMTIRQNDVLARHLGQVRASRGRQKSRVLHATGTRPAAPRWPRSSVLGPPAGLTLHHRGDVFAEGRLDAGTRLLLTTLERNRLPEGEALDVGCGSGVLALWLAARDPRRRVGASDVSAAAVESTRRGAEAAGLPVTVRQADGLAGQPDGSLDLLLSNPPFHRGAAKDSTPTLTLIADAATALRPGGELWLVWNGHLPYLPRLRAVGPTEVVARDRWYLVTRTHRR